MTLPGELSVGIQGIAASFHDEAARLFFSGRRIHTVPSSSFALLCQGLKQKQTNVAVMAIENSIAGSILPNYSLMEANSFQIFGEVYLKIQLNLMALPGQKLEDIQVIKSHPMALLQCQNFLMSCPWIKVAEGSDTAASAKEIQESGSLGVAAIASHLAAETYKLEVIRSGIESNSKNYTRFLVICRGEDYRNYLSAYVADPNTGKYTLNKSSLRFEVPDRPGSLLNVLETLNRYGINMTHLQSVVIHGRPYEYSFHVDLEWGHADAYIQAMKELRSRSLRMIHFGEYPRGIRPSE